MPSSTADRTKEQGQASAHPWLSSYPKGVVWHQHFAAKPLYSLLDDAVSRYPNKPCTNFLGKVLTYSEIGHQVDRAAAGLQRLGVAKGTKVGLFLPNSPTYIVFYFAVLKIGAIVVNFNPLYTVEELSFQVRDSETDLMITLDLKVLFDKVEALLSSGVLNRAVVCSFAALLPVAKSVLFRLLKGRDLAQIDRSPVARQIIPGARVMANDGVYSRPNLDPENDIAVLQYTGGTTGTPKGAMLTHANLYINVMQVVAWAPGLEEGRERVMGVLPFFHVFAMTVVMNFGIARAAELVIMPRFVLADALKLITETRPTVMPGVPTLFNAMLNHPQLRSYDLSSLRFCLSGGAPLPVEVKHKFEALTGCKLVEGYGLSETSPVVTANPLEGPVKAGSIGQPLPGTLVSLRDLADPAKATGTGPRRPLPSSSAASSARAMSQSWTRTASSTLSIASKTSSSPRASTFIRAGSRRRSTRIPPSRR
jgi:long-chain acyl-CoA synthetase